MLDLVVHRSCSSHKLRTNRRKTAEVELAILLEDKKNKSTTAI